MKPEIKQIWVDALKSCQYKQARWRLCLSGKFCALGVLGDIYVGATKRAYWSYDTFFLVNDPEIAKYCDLPDEVEEWAGIDKYVQQTIAELNDTKELDFEEIATYIEEYL